MTVVTTGYTFFEEWILSEKAKPKIELHIYYPYLDEDSWKIKLMKMDITKIL